MGPVRMISSGHELTTDYDEKTLHELGFKDMQVLPARELQTNGQNFTFVFCSWLLNVGLGVIHLWGDATSGLESPQPQEQNQECSYTKWKQTQTSFVAVAENAAK